MADINNGLISVIVPLYNGRRYIHRLIDKMMIQDYKDWELLIIDDGSLDDGASIASSYSNGNAKIHVFGKENGGICSARNYGLDRASGEFVAFIDQDDEISNTYLSDLISGTTSNINMVVGGQSLSLLDNNGSEISKETKQYIDKVIDTDEELANYIFNNNNDSSSQHVWNCLYRINLIKENNIRFDEAYRYGGEDIMFNMQYAYHAKIIHFIPKIVYYYFRRIGESTSTKNKPIDFNTFFHSANIIYNLFDGSKKCYKQNVTQYILRGITHNYFRNTYGSNDSKFIKDFCVLYNKFVISFGTADFSAIPSHRAIYKTIDFLLRHKLSFGLLIIKKVFIHIPWIRSRIV